MKNLIFALILFTAHLALAATLNYVGRFTGDGAAVTNLNAANLAAGTVPLARLGTNTAAANGFQVLIPTGNTTAWSSNPIVGGNLTVIGTLGVTSTTTLGTVNAGAVNSSSGITGNGAGLTNLSAAGLNLTNRIASGLSLVGTTTNLTAGGSNWVGGLSMWNPATGKTVAVTNGSITTTGNITDTQNGVSTVISSNTITTGSSTNSGNVQAASFSVAGESTLLAGNFTLGPGKYQTFSGRSAFNSPNSDVLYFGTQNAGEKMCLVLGNNALPQQSGLWATTNYPALRVENYTNNVSLSLRRGTNVMAGDYASLILSNLTASGTITSTNGVFGASGTIALTTNVSIAMAAATYTNVLFSVADYTNVFGGVTASTDGAMTNTVAGRYFISIGASFTGAGGASLYEGAVFTNDVECSIIEWQRDVSATYGNANSSGILTLPANCRIGYRIKSPDAETASFSKVIFTVMGAN